MKILLRIAASHSESELLGEVEGDLGVDGGVLGHNSIQVISRPRARHSITGQLPALPAIKLFESVSLEVVQPHDPGVAVAGTEELELLSRLFDLPVVPGILHDEESTVEVSIGFVVVLAERGDGSQGKRIVNVPRQDRREEIRVEKDAGPRVVLFDSKVISA